MGHGRAYADADVTAEFLVNMSASADVLAMAKVEVDLNAIPEGKNVSIPFTPGLRGWKQSDGSLNTRHQPQVIIKWRGKPVFIRHRTAAEIEEANKVNVASLRDPENDDDRVQKPEWLVMLGTYSRPFAVFALWELIADPNRRRLHPSRLRPHRRGRRLRRLVLPLPRLPLRHLRPDKKGSCPSEPRDPRVRLPGGGQAGHWLEGGFTKISPLMLWDVRVTKDTWEWWQGGREILDLEMGGVLEYCGGAPCFA